MRQCLSLTPGSPIAVFYDNNSRNVYEILEKAAALLDASIHGFNIDEFKRPLHSLPEKLGRLIRDAPPEASFYVAGVKPGELPFRSSLVKLLTSLGARHVHMPKANPYILSRAASCAETARTTQKVYDILRNAKKIEATAPGGTRLSVEVGAYRWVADTGVIGPGEWGNWPPGEVYTTPANIEGVLVVDGVLGDYFSEKYGFLGRPVAKLYIREGVITRVEGELSKELSRYLSKEECGLRIGEIGIGTNTGITRPIGNMLHDEKMPGIHVAAGDPLGEATGADWRCGIHVDMLPLNASIRADSLVIVDKGRIMV